MEARPIADKYRLLTPRVIPATREMLDRFTAKELWGYAQSLGVYSQFRTKDHVIGNLIASGRATICATLGD